MTVTEGRNEDEDDQETYRTPIKLVEDIDAAGQDEGIDLEEQEVDRMEVDEFTSEALIVARAPSRYFDLAPFLVP